MITIVFAVEINRGYMFLISLKLDFGLWHVCKVLETLFFKRDIFQNFIIKFRNCFKTIS